MLAQGGGEKAFLDGLLPFFWDVALDTKVWLNLLP